MFCGPRLRWKMDQKVTTFKLQKMETVFSTLVRFLAMECQWTCIGWLLIDLGTSSTPKFVFCRPRSRWKMDPKVATFKLQKMETVFSTLVGFLAMECGWTCIGWLLIGLGHSQGLAQRTFGPHRCPRASPNGQKWQNFRAKKSAKNPKKIWKFFF